MVTKKEPRVEWVTISLLVSVGVVCLVGGFVLASTFFLPLNISSRGNQGSAILGNTVYGGGSSSTGFTVAQAPGPTCSTLTKATTTSNSTAYMLAWMKGSNTSSCPGPSSPEFYEVLTFISANQTVSPHTKLTLTDNFTVTMGQGASPTYYSSTLETICVIDNSAGSSTVTSTCTLQANVDTGVSSTSPQPVIDSIQVTVTGD